ncbi:hypothetical protein Ciccas_001936 [Cichlidogyrus casuarinus]|uniref:HECT-type E3 ubiquitin transferase n=1 Tax=Cichlidogyrus casuarinus TaxID=1844966 RepID=A0ABD2QLT9_9PLAT
MELYFQVHYEIFDEARDHELKSGGKEIKPNLASLFLEWVCSGYVEKQIKAFKEGFQDILPLNWLDPFDEKELDLLISGTNEIDIDDWEKNTDYRNYTKSSEQIEWFWIWLRSSDQEKRVRFLEFVSGTGRLPAGGFAALEGSRGPQKFCIENSGYETHLPIAHTCFYRLDMPPYSTYERLCEKMNKAVDETEGFGQD